MTDRRKGPDGQTGVRGPMKQDTTPSTAAENPMDQVKDKLDALWVEYLDLLHQYDNAQRELAKHMSTVNLNLS